MPSFCYLARSRAMLCYDTVVGNGGTSGDKKIFIFAKNTFKKVLTNNILFDII